MQSKSKLSIFKNWKNYIPHISFFILLIAALFLGYRYFFEGRFQGKPDYAEDYSKKASLDNLPEYLRLENLETIEGMKTIEYLRVLMIKYYPMGKKEAEKKAKQELELKFPGERSRVLIRLLELFVEWEQAINEIRDNEDLDGYQKKLTSLQKRKEIFGEIADNYLFPDKDYEKMELFFLYTKRYVKKHREDEVTEIRDHLEKAKLEIYGDDFDRLKELEPFEKKYELELLIHERELGILNLEERRLRLLSIKRKLQN